MGFHEVGLLIGFRVLLGFAEFLDQTHRSALQATVESAAGACMDNVTELFRGEVEESGLQMLEVLGVGSRRGDGVAMLEHSAKEHTGRDQCRDRRICGRLCAS